MRIRDWSSDVCSSDLERFTGPPAVEIDGDIAMVWAPYTFLLDGKPHHCGIDHFDLIREGIQWKVLNVTWSQRTTGCGARSEEHTSELQSLMRISYAVFCLKKKTNRNIKMTKTTI